MRMLVLKLNRRRPKWLPCCTNKMAAKSYLGWPTYTV
jgi:hypothetical protein